MLWVYTEFADARQEFLKQYPGALDWADSTPQELVTQAETVLSHHSDIAVFLGYLDGWMLSITEEIRLRRLIRKYPVCVVTRWPIALSFAWKNELKLLHVNPSQSDGHSYSNNDGRAGADALQDEHGHSAARSPNSASASKGRKAGGAAPRRKRKGPNPPPNPDDGAP